MGVQTRDWSDNTVSGVFVLLQVLGFPKHTDTNNSCWVYATNTVVVRNKYSEEQPQRFSVFHFNKGIQVKSGRREDVGYVFSGIHAFR
jgi:hypothetical protein